MAEDRAAGTLADQQSGPLKILIADDNPTDRMILARLVSRLGHAVISAENGLEALVQFSVEIGRASCRERV